LHAATKSSNNRNIWPGKFAPSLANISIKKNNHMNNNPIDNIHDNKTKSKDAFYRSDNMKYVKYMPMVKLGSTSLSLMPTARSKTIAMSSTWRTTNNNKFFTVT
jgi:predicted metal-dependent phosphotriesterase family hydrolase